MFTIGGKVLLFMSFLVYRGAFTQTHTYTLTNALRHTQQEDTVL